MKINVSTLMVEEIRNINPLKIQKKKCNDIVFTNFPYHKIIYTDGSKSNIKTGLAIISVIVIIKVLNLIENNNWTNTNLFLIASDQQPQ